MNVVIYARYSSSSQRDDSIEIQLRGCHKYCEDNGMTIVEEYIDRAYSGTNDKRPAFRQMIDDSYKHTFERIIVYRLNRFARSKVDSVKYKGLLSKNNIKVLSVTEPLSDDPSSILVESIIEGFDEFYSRELSVKIRSGMDLNAERCLSTGGNVALGFRIGADKRFEIDETTAPIVRRIFESYANGKTVTEIVTELNEQGFKTSRGVPFNKNSLHTMLKNKRYIGTYTYKGTETPNGMPRIISDELFNKVAEIMEKNKKAPARAKAKVEYLLTTKLYCGHCKEMMTGFSGTGKQGKVYRYYICNGTKKKQCKKKNVSKDYIENLVLTECRKILTTKNTEMIAKEVEAVFNSGKDTSYLRQLKKELAKNERKIQKTKLSVLECEDEDVRKIFYSEMTSLLKSNSELNRQIEIESAAMPEINEAKIKFFLRALRNGDINDIKYQKCLINIFVNKIYLYDDRLTIIFNTSDEPVTINDLLLSDIEADAKLSEGLFIKGPPPPIAFTLECESFFI